MPSKAGYRSKQQVYPVNRHIHRIGRSGRFGRKGVAINLVTPVELRELKNIESYYATQIVPLPNNISAII